MQGSWRANVGLTCACSVLTWRLVCHAGSCCSVVPHNFFGPIPACPLETAHRCSTQELERRYGALEEACAAKEREGHRLMKAGSVFFKAF